MRGRMIVTERATDGRSRAALVVDGRLEDLLIDPPAGDPVPAPGALYCAKIERLVPKMGAAFVRLGPDTTGFLRDAKGVREGERHLVQVVSYPEAGKASPVTRRVLHKTRTVIVTPDAPGLNISRRIRDAQVRERLREAAEAALSEGRAMAAPEGSACWEDPGLILRSQAESASDDTIAQDIAEAIAAHAETAEAMMSAAEGPIRPAPDAATLALREWTGEPRTGFEAHGICSLMDGLTDPTTSLPGGGWMAVEATRAMVTVDVNTATAFGAGAALRANLDAARDLPRQLRLRGLGGVVTVDFAPLPRKDRRRIEDALTTSFRHDPVETSLAGWTPLGLFEIQRKRERRVTAPLIDG